jgi:hypothetical protein
VFVIDCVSSDSFCVRFVCFVVVGSNVVVVVVVVVIVVVL